MKQTFFSKFGKWVLEDKHVMSLLIAQLLSQSVLQFSRSIQNTIVSPTVSRLSMDNDAASRQYNFRELLTAFVALLINMLLLFVISSNLMKYIKA